MVRQSRFSGVDAGYPILTSKQQFLCFGLRILRQAQVNTDKKLFFPYFCILTRQSYTDKHKSILKNDRAEGWEEAREVFATSLLQEGMELDMFVKLTNLNRKQVDTLRKNLNGSSG